MPPLLVCGLEAEVTGWGFSGGCDPTQKPPRAGGAHSASAGGAAETLVGCFTFTYLILFKT